MAERRKTIWKAGTMLSPVPAVLVGCGDVGKGTANLLTVAWTGIVCSEPPMLSISVRPERHSYGLICGSGEFTVNVPSARLAAAVDACGVLSGRDVDKFAKCRLTALKGSQVAAPLVAECPIAMECRVAQRLALGSHDLFIAQILAVQVDSDIVDEKGRLDIDKAGLLAYAHGHYYEFGRCIGHFGFSVRRKPGPIVRR